MFKYFMVLTFLLFSSLAQAKPVRIAILDSGLNVKNKEDVKLCPSGHLDVTGTGFEDKIGHGTNIAYIIANTLKDVDYCIVIIKIFDSKSSTLLPSTELALLYLLHLEKIDLVNYSAGGRGYQYAETVLIKGLKVLGTTFVAAAGNEGRNLDESCDYYPACYPDVISVGNMETETKRNKLSNYGKRVVSWELGTNVCGGGFCLSGTSQATAVHTARLARKLAEKGAKK